LQSSVDETTSAVLPWILEWKLEKPPIRLMDAMDSYYQMAESFIPNIKARIESLEAGSPGKFFCV
jgi:hypothetical protein